RSGVPLNPEVMATGPIDPESLDIKYAASRDVGRIQCLLATSPKRLNHRDASGVMPFRINNDSVPLEKYFKIGQGNTLVWESINRRHPKILSIKDARWDQPLVQAQRHLAPPLIPTVGRHQEAL